MARAAAAQPSVVRSPVGPLHRVSTCNPPPVRVARAPGSSAVRDIGSNVRPVYGPPQKRCLVLLLPRVSGECYNERFTMRVYFDYNATTPLAPEVARRGGPRATRDVFGNASSVHHFGQQAKAALDEARSAVAALINADPSEIVFTSGGTESDNFAIRGAAEALEPTGRRHLIASAHRARSGAQHAQGARPPRLADDAAPGRSDRHRLAGSAARGDRPTTRRSSR